MSAVCAVLGFWYFIRYGQPISGHAYTETGPDLVCERCGDVMRGTGR